MRRRPANALLSLALAAVAMLAFVSCDDITGPPDASTPTPIDSGIRGLVQLSPTCPGPTLADPCTSPLAKQLVIVDASGKEVTRVTSAVDGTFQVTLPPGEYTVNPAPNDPLPIAPPQSVSVVAGTYTDVQIDYDSGIRIPDTPLPTDFPGPSPSSS